MEYRIGKRVAVLAALLTGLAFTTPALAQKKSDSVVKTSAKAEKPDADGKQVVTITLEIEPGWHTYANPVGQDDLADAKTVITVGAKTKPEAVKVAYPKGTAVDDKVIGKYFVYEDKTTIKATVTRAKGDASPLNLTIKFQACNDKTCLLPATVKLTVE